MRLKQRIPKEKSSKKPLILYPVVLAGLVLLVWLLKDPAMRRYYLWRIQSDSPSTRAEAAQWLGTQRGKAIDGLVGVMRTTKRNDVRQDCANAISYQCRDHRGQDPNSGFYVTDDELREVFAPLLADDQSQAQRLSLLAALSDSGRAAGGEPIKGLLERKPDEELRRQAIEALSRIRSRASVEALLGVIISDDKEHLAGLAETSLRTAAPPDALEIMTERIRTPPPNLSPIRQAMLARALEGAFVENKNRLTVEQMAGYLKYPDPPGTPPAYSTEIRMAAVKALKARDYRGTEEAKYRLPGDTCLLVLERDPDATVRMEAVSALDLNRVRINSFPDKIQRLAGFLETETSPEVLLGILGSLKSFNVTSGAEQMANVINGYRMEDGKKVPLANLDRLNPTQRAEVQQQTVECFREMRAVTEPRTRLMVMYAILYWSQGQPGEESWVRTSAVIQHVVSRDGMPYAGWKLNEWSKWYNDRAREEGFRAQLERLKAQALKAANNRDVSMARNYNKQYGDVWDEIIKIADPQQAQEDVPGGTSQIKQEAEDAKSDLAARLGFS